MLVHNSLYGNREHAIPLREFGNLAKKIAQSATGVPSDIIRIANRAIASRKRCNEWFGTLENVNSQSISTHDYFIRVLEDTLALLVGPDTQISE